VEKDALDALDYLSSVRLNIKSRPCIQKRQEILPGFNPKKGKDKTYNIGTD
jgi:hypothetical protein